MADVSVTANNVLVADSVRVSAVETAVTVTAGKVMVYDSANANYVLASNASALLSGSAGALPVVMTVGSAGANQRVAVVGAGNTITLGSVLTKGRVYVLSTNGNISPESDAATNDYLVIIGHAISATELYFNPQSTGIQVA